MTLCWEVHYLCRVCVVRGLHDPAFRPQVQVHFWATDEVPPRQCCGGDMEIL